MKTRTQLHVSSHGSKWNRYDLNNIIGTRPHARPTHKSPFVIKTNPITYSNHFPSSIIEGLRTLQDCLLLENQWQINKLIYIYMNCMCEVRMQHRSKRLWKMIIEKFILQWVTIGHALRACPKSIITLLVMDFLGFRNKEASHLTGILSRWRQWKCPVRNYPKG
jgi:hypothetical protein